MNKIANAIWGIGCLACGVYGEAHDIIGSEILIILAVICMMVTPKDDA